MTGPHAPQASWHRVVVPAVIGGLALFATACGGPRHRLGEHDFRSATLAVVSIVPPHPDIFGGTDLDVDGDDPLGSILRVGSEVARETEARRLRSRLDSAAVSVDVGERMARRIHENAARHLRATPVDSGRAGAYELEVRIQRYGIRTAAGTGGAHFWLEGDVLLLDGRTGRLIWDTEVWSRDPVRLTSGDDRTIANVATAVALSRLSVADLSRSLEALADYAADAVLRQLTRDLDDARRR